MVQSLQKLRKLCRYLLKIENVYFCLIFTQTHLVFGFLIFVYIYIYIYIYIYKHILKLQANTVLNGFR